MNIGQYNTLKVVFKGSDGFSLEDEATGERAMLPARDMVQEISTSVTIGQELRVFVYLDAAEGAMATMRTAKVSVGQCAYLKVVDVNEIGAFLDWGLRKDLFVPFAQQTTKMQLGRSYVVCVYLDNTGRIAASAKIDGYLSDDGRGFNTGDEVDILLWERTPLGYKAIINDTHLGMLFDSEVLGAVRIGTALHGYVAEVRSDSKINLTLQQHTAEARDDLQEEILEHLRENDGASTLTDKSSPEDIFKAFGVSKKNYKKALGALYRSKVIELTADLVSLK